MATKTNSTNKPNETKSPVRKVPAKRANKTNKSLAKRDLALPDNSSVLDQRIFAYPVNEALLAQVIHVYRDNTHQNTSKVKTRGELTRTTKKMYKQKGTGNARHGSKMSPTFVGGGIVFGPTGVKPGNLKINRKMRASALAGILSAYSKDNSVELISSPVLSKPQVKSVKNLLAKPDTILVYSQETPAFVSSVRNLSNVTLIESGKLNAYSVIQSKFVALTPSAHEALVARLLPLLKSRKLDLAK